MGEKLTQKQRLDYLVEEFKADSDEYKDLQTPNDTDGKQRVLRSLMNIRMPGKLSDEVFLVQDEYLAERAKEKGIVQHRLSPALERDLADCYRNTLNMCAENALKSVAFCCISTGVFHFPNKRAAEIAVAMLGEWLASHPGQMERVIFNVFKDEDKKYYEGLV